MMKPVNQTQICFPSNSVNESFGRAAVSAFLAQLDPTVSDLTELKTAVSEAVTNAIVHGYDGGDGTVYLDAEIQDRTITIVVKDTGVGIEDIDKAMEPLYTTKPDEERAGMGFMFMEAFMDDLEVQSELGKGTTVIMKKTIIER